MDSTASEPVGFLFFILIVLIILSGFFSGTETGMMSINRYRLKHRAKNNHAAAKRVLSLLERTDKLIGVILLGNNFVNNFAAMVVTLIATKLWGEYAVGLAVTALTIVMLIFSELTPKTLAANHPERIAFPASYLILPLLRILAPLVWLINVVANSLLKLFGVVHESHEERDKLSPDELRTVVHEAGSMIPRRHQKMLLSILDLENVTVDDIMVPKSEIVGINLNAPQAQIESVLGSCQHTRLLLYYDNLDRVEGFIHTRDALHLIATQELDVDSIKRCAQPIYYVPEGTPLNTQLLKFQRKRERIGLIVDEYGVINGLVTLEDILEEIVGEFTTDFAQTSKDVLPQQDGSFVVDGSALLRELNRDFGWAFPMDGPKTLSGIIIENMETIPSIGTSVRIAGYPIEILKISDNRVKSAKIFPKMRQKGSAGFSWGAR